MRIESLYRYPVKGLTPELLDEARLTPGRCIPWDRAFALAQGDGVFDPARPAWVPKSNFMCLLRNARIALLDTRFDEATGLLRLTPPAGDGLSADPMTAGGQAALTAYLVDFLGDEARYGAAAPRFAYVEGHSFCDHRTQVVSLIGLGSLRALEDAAGAARDKAVPGQCVCGGVGGLGGVRLDRQDAQHRAGAAGGAGADRPVRGDHGEPGHRRAGRQPGEGAATGVRACRFGSFCRGGGGGDDPAGECDRGVSKC